MKTKAILAACLLVGASLQAQSFEFAKSFGGSESDGGYSITMDEDGNIYTVGFFKGTVDFDPGVGIFNLSSAGSDDVFIQKLDASGNFIWAKSIGGGEFDIARSIAVDDIGNVYVVGDFQDTVDFDPSEAIYELTSVGFTDAFLLKLDASGNFLWARSFGGDIISSGRSIALDALGNVYVTGFFDGTGDFDLGTSTEIITSVGLSDVFVLKIDASGNFLWVNGFGSNLEEISNSIKVDALGNVYILGIFEGTVDFDPGAGIANLTSEGEMDVFVQKLDASGNFLWARTFGGIRIDVGISFTLDALGNVYSTGFFSGIVDFDPGVGVFNLDAGFNTGIYVQKLDALGNFVWAKSFGVGLFSQGFSIAVDTASNVYTVGGYLFSGDFNPDEGTLIFDAVGNFDAFVQKLDASGNFLWAKSFGNVEYDIAESIIVDESGSIFITGSFNETVDFDFGAGTANLTSGGEGDVYVLKMNQGEPTGLVDMGSGIKVRAFPNPSTGLVQLTFEQAFSNVSIVLTDLQGKKVYSKQFDVVANEQLVIEGGSGVYFLSVKAPQGHSILKLIKE